LRKKETNCKASEIQKERNRDSELVKKTIALPVTAATVLLMLS
jgi:hypothetical protein